MRKALLVPPFIRATRRSVAGNGARSPSERSRACHSAPLSVASFALTLLAGLSALRDGDHIKRMLLAYDEAISNDFVLAEGGQQAPLLFVDLGFVEGVHGPLQLQALVVGQVELRPDLDLKFVHHRPGLRDLDLVQVEVDVAAVQDAHHDVVVGRIDLVVVAAEAFATTTTGQSAP